MAEDDDLMMPEVSADEGVTDPNAASEEEPRDSEIDQESPPGMTSFFSSLFLYRHLLTYFFLAS